MRAKILTLISVAYFIAGLNVYLTKVPRALLAKADPSISAHLRLFTLHQVGFLFMFVSIGCLIGVAFKKVDYAYSAMTFLIVFWTSLYFLSWAETGYWKSIYGIANYALVSGILILCSRIPDMPKGMELSKNTPLPFEGYRFTEEDS